MAIGYSVLRADRNGYFSEVKWKITVTTIWICLQGIPNPVVDSTPPTVRRVPIWHGKFGGLRRLYPPGDRRQRAQLALPPVLEGAMMCHGVRWVIQL